MSDGVTIEIITTIAAREGVDPTELPPLWDAVDTEALNRLSQSAASNSSLHVRFSYQGYDIVVDGTDSVAITQSTQQVQ
ncbi:hypothetical protein D8Y22_00600 [Salinadaptatus halalkaliphilus]|uniref:Halobacterial output domain-containing protein n=1 Tax=Salinadaptatus halalkaliphilus TaxID=2419781 RepID=A0A4S3TVF6_9EURY|nr:HalOD1 output domain-containing protein [Salinadaptatus halalkaliphilus]THE66668.1 hypothetical protein D8Y22_00600 [Salinadaptatus halalkaliphilus]